MKIAIYANELTLEQNTGVKIYTNEILRSLAEIDERNQYFIYAKKQSEELSFFNKFKNFKVRIISSQLPLWTYNTFPKWLLKDKPDILFMPIQTVPFVFKPKELKIVVTIHDLAFLLFSGQFTFKKKFLLNFHTKRAAKMADKIIVPSNATKNDVIKLYGVDESRIKVIYHGVSEFPSREGIKGCVDFDSSKFNTPLAPLKRGILGRHDLSNYFREESKGAESYKPYILFVGSLQPRKNIERLIEAFEIVKNKNQNSFDLGGVKYNIRELKLVICGGRGWMYKKICGKAKNSEFSKDIIFTGGVGRNQLDDLYKNAFIFILPSLYEGFGLPVAEAMNFGIPCIVSDNSSLSEIAGGNALLVDCNSASDIAEKISMLINNIELREKYSIKSKARAEKFSWEKSAREHLEVFEGDKF